MAKAVSKRKAANGYKFAERLPKGEVLEDITKNKWKLGSPIGQGGFGDIYSAQEAGSSGSNYPHVIKIEPHTNGPLFVEMHFYMRNAKPVDVEAFKKEKGLKTFGMPIYLGSGSLEYKNEKYRFVVMEKFGTDLWKVFLENNRSFPPETVFKLAIQILDVLEYIHGRGYVHADIKGANILMGVVKGTTNQAYLVDFGLATKFSTEKEFKPNPKKAHDGTIEYLSRDAHKGVQTRRGDLEILAYNLIHWLGCTLPWESNLKDPNAVQKSKEESMSSVPKMIKACFGHKTPPGAIVDFLNYLKTLKFDSEPDYKKIRKIFLSGVKDAGGSENSPLVFSLSKKTPQKRKVDGVKPSPKRKRGRQLKKHAEDEIENFEEDSDNEVSNSVQNSNQKADIEKENDNKKKVNTKKANKNSETTENQKSDIDDDDIIDDSYEENLSVKKKGVKEKDNEKPNKKKVNTKKANKNSKVGEADEDQNSLKETKTEVEPNEATDPYEGYTDAMKEVMKKKLENGKSKGRKHKTTVVNDDDTEGYNDGMKEVVQRKKEKLASKKKVNSEKPSVPSTANKVQNEEGVAREGRLRTRKEVCYYETSD